MLPQPSTEQQIIIDASINHNLIINSVAGSGKTTTIMHIAKASDTDKILLLTYNSHLKNETRQRIASLGLTNIECHSYHAFCVKYYREDCQNDKVILDILRLNIPPKKKFEYTFIIIDEAQDLTGMFFQLIKKIIADGCPGEDTKYAVIGDERQNIYKFKDADSRFLTFADTLFSSNIPWKTLRLSESYRITPGMADYVNKCLLNENYIKSAKTDGTKVRYIICNTFDSSFGKASKRFYPFEELTYYLDMGYNYQDVFIIAPSVQSEKSPVRQFANYLTKQGIPVFVPCNDQATIRDSDILHNKIVLTTFHQTKGLERKVVIIFGFDDGYYKFHGKDENPNFCSNVLYVAATRAKEHLSILHHNTSNLFLFTKQGVLKKVCDYQEINKYNVKETFKTKTSEFNVTQLIKFMSTSTITKALDYLTVTELTKPGKKIEIPGKTKQGNLMETVEEINGVVIPALFELKKNGILSIHKKNQSFANRIELSDDEDCDFSNSDCELSDDDEPIIFTKIPSIKNVNKTIASSGYKGLSIPEILFIATSWNAYTTGYEFKISQIKNYNWLTNDEISRTNKRLSKLLTGECEFEVNLEQNMNDALITGSIDCIEKGDVNIIYEFKCVENIQSEQILQLAIYAWLYKTNNPDDEPAFYLYNILNNNCYEIESSIENLNEMVSHLVKMKMSGIKEITDKEFEDLYGVSTPTETRATPWTQ
jgi:AAA domain/UvrD-like helicase C-terminal domain